MLDHATKWDAAPDWSTARLDAGGVSICSLDLPNQLWVSGNLAAFGKASGLDRQGAGALGVVHGDAYTVRLARDRLLVVGAPAAAISEGWNDAGYGVTAMGGATHVFELGGEKLDALLATATTIDLAHPGPSAAVSFASTPAILYRHEPSGRLRLHVERGLAVSAWTWLRAVLED